MPGGAVRASRGATPADAEPAEAQLPLGYNPFIGNAIGRNYRLGIRTRF